MSRTRFYRPARVAFRMLALPLFRFRVEGAERIPATGPGIVVARHRSWLDPACVCGASQRPVIFLMHEDVYHKPWGRWFFRAMGTIPVPVGGGLATAALKDAVRCLERGELLGIFPEGGIGREGAPARLFPGAARLAVRFGAPLIPMAILGSAEAWPHGSMWPRPARVRVRIGRPLESTPEPGGTDGMVEDLLRRTAEALEEIAGETA